MNVWLALSWGSHQHSAPAWEWFDRIREGELEFCGLTQLGLLRLLTTKSVMGADCMTVKRAWGVYDRWLQDSRIAMRREPPEIGELFRMATAPFAQRAAPKALGDCYLLALSQAYASTLVTFDAGLADLAIKRRHPVVLLR